MGIINYKMSPWGEVARIEHSNCSQHSEQNKLIENKPIKNELIENALVPIRRNILVCRSTRSCIPYPSFWYWRLN
jgi:hypothetical protein